MINIFCVRPKGFNVGNDAIFLGMKHFLDTAFGRVVNVISIPATARYESHSTAGLTARTVYDINQYGHGVIVGGGNLYENGELDVDLQALSSLEVPLMLFSLSRGRVYNRNREMVERTDVMPSHLIEALNDKAQISLARDHATHEWLKGRGILKAQLGGCPTIFLDRLAERLPRLSEADRNLVLVSVRTPELMSVPLSVQAQVRENVRGIVEFLKRQGPEDVRLLCHDHRDISFAASFTGLNYIYTGDVYSYLSLLRSCRLNVGYRLHSALPCLSFGTPVIKISYDERSLSLMDTVGYGHWNIDTVRSSDVLADVEDRYSRLPELMDPSAEVRSTWRQHDESMSTAFRSFASAVTAYAGTALRDPVAV